MIIGQQVSLKMSDYHHLNVPFTVCSGSVVVV